MINRRIVELAIETLENHRTEVALEMEAIRIMMNEGAAPKAIVPTRRRRRRTAAERKAQSVRMRGIWASRRAAAAKSKIAKKPTSAKIKLQPKRIPKKL